MKRMNFVTAALGAMLAFASAGCENNTTTIMEVPVIDAETVKIRQQRDLLAALNRDAVTVYVLADLTLDTPIKLRSGQNIVVGGGEQSGGTIVKSTGGTGGRPLFDEAAAAPALNIAANLTLESGSSLTIAGGASVNIIAGTEDAKVELLVSEGAAAGVGVNVSGASIGTTGLGSLNVGSNASLRLKEGATLAVNGDTAKSKVKLEDTSSAITIETGAKLAVVDYTNAAKVIGNGGDVVIEIPSGAIADIGEITVYTDAAASVPVSDAVQNEINAKIKDSVSDSPAQKETETATGVQDLLDTPIVTKVTYAGEGALGAVKVPSGKKLVITKTVADGNSITVESGASLEIAAGASIGLGANGAITIAGTGAVKNKGTVRTAAAGASALADVLAVKGKIAAEGTVVYGDADSTLTVTEDTELTISGSLTVAAGKTLTNSGTLTIAEKGSLTNSGSLTNNGTLTIAAEGALTNNGTLANSGSLTIAENGTLTNSGTIEAADAAKLAQVLGLTGITGKVSVSGTGDVPIASATIPQNVTLTVLANQTLKVTTSLDGAGGITTDGTGRVEVAEAAAFTVNGTVTGDVTQDVSATYALSEVKDVNPTGLNATAKRDLTTAGKRLVTITLKGEVGVVIPYSDSPDSVYYDMFDVQDLDEILIAENVAKGYSAVVIKGLVTHGTSGKIKQYNQGFHLWNTPIPEDPYIHDRGENNDNPYVYREKTYTDGNFYPSAIGGFDIILWGGATRKTITLEITQNEVTNNFLIKYDEVTFTDAKDAWALDDDTDKTTSGITIKEATRSADGVNTIWLEGTSVTEALPAVEAIYGPKEESYNLGGKYAIVTIKDFYKPGSIGSTNGLEYKITSPSWAYYLDNTNNDTAPVTGARTEWPWTYVDKDNYNNSVVWRKKAENNSPPVAGDADLTLLLWDPPTTGITPAVVKSATIVVTPPTTVEGSYNYTVIVDWSGVTIE